MITKALFRQRKYAALLVITLLVLGTGIPLIVYGTQTYMLKSYQLMISARSPNLVVTTRVSPSNFFSYSGGVLSTVKSNESTLSVIARILGVEPRENTFLTELALLDYINNISTRSFWKAVDSSPLIDHSMKGNITFFRLGYLPLEVSVMTEENLNVAVKENASDIVIANQVFRSLYAAKSHQSTAFYPWHTTIYNNIQDYYYSRIKRSITNITLALTYNLVNKTYQTINSSMGPINITKAVYNAALIKAQILPITLGIYNNKKDLQLIGYQLPSKTRSPENNCIPALIGPAFQALLEKRGLWNGLGTTFKIGSTSICVTGVLGKNIFNIKTGSPVAPQPLGDIQSGRLADVYISGKDLPRLLAALKYMPGGEQERIGYGLYFLGLIGLKGILTAYNTTGETSSKPLSLTLLDAARSLNSTIIPFPGLLYSMSNTTFWTLLNSTRTLPGLVHGTGPDAILFENSASLPSVTRINMVDFNPRFLAGHNLRDSLSELAKISSAYFQNLEEVNATLLEEINATSPRLALEIMNIANGNPLHCFVRSYEYQGTSTVYSKYYIDINKLDCNLYYGIFSVGSSSQSSMLITDFYRTGSGMTSTISLALITLVLMVLIAVTIMTSESLGIMIVSARRWLAVLVSRGGDPEVWSAYLTIHLALASIAAGISGLFIAAFVTSLYSGTSFSTTLAIMRNYKLAVGLILIVLILGVYATRRKLRDLRSIEPGEAFRPVEAIRKAGRNKRGIFFKTISILALVSLSYGYIKMTPDQLMDTLGNSLGVVGNFIGFIYVMIVFLFFSFAPFILAVFTSTYLSSKPEILLLRVERLLERVWRSGAAKLGTSSSKRIREFMQAPIRAATIGLASFTGLLFVAGGLDHFIRNSSGTFLVIVLNNLLSTNDMLGLPGTSYAFNLMAPVLAFAVAASVTAAIVRVYDSIAREIVVLRARGASVGEVARFVYAGFLPVLVTTIVSGIIGGLVLLVGYSSALRVMITVMAYPESVLKAVRLPNLVPWTGVGGVVLMLVLFLYILLLPLVLALNSVRRGSIGSRLREVI